MLRINYWWSLIATCLFASACILAFLHGDTIVGWLIVSAFIINLTTSRYEKERYQ